MAITKQKRVGKAMDLLRAGLSPLPGQAGERARTMPDNHQRPPRPRSCR
jgi:hypothetical protein